MKKALCLAMTLMLAACPAMAGGLESYTPSTDYTSYFNNSDADSDTGIQQFSLDDSAPDTDYSSYFNNDDTDADADAGSAGGGLLSSAPELSDYPYSAPDIEIQQHSLDDSAPSTDYSSYAGDADTGSEIPSGGGFVSNPETSDYSIDIPEVEIQQHALESSAPNLTGYLAEDMQAYYADMVGSLSNEELGALSQMPEADAAAFVQRQYELIADLTAAFSAVGIDVQVNRITGVVAIGAELLYATDQYQVTPSGKEILRIVFQTYCDVLASAKYRDYISKILIVGHTDSVGSYEYNQGLSQRRADAAKDFCLSPECGISDPVWVASKLAAEGRSYDQLIRNADGTENKAASRRVELGFVMLMTA